MVVERAVHAAWDDGAPNAVAFDGVDAHAVDTVGGKRIVELLNRAAKPGRA